MNRKEQNGFTLVELLVAVTVLAVGLLGVAGLQGSMIRKNVSAMKNTEATALIEDKIEEIRNTPYDNIPEGVVDENGLGTSGDFSRRTTVQKDTPVPGRTKTVTIDVSWNDPNQKTFSFTTVVCN
jgi:type IV pilus modification protein PilV